MRNSLTNNQLRSLAMAMAGAATAAVGTMFVPVAVLEGLTGSTGLSELVPATAAPLGDTARAMIAFGTGGLTLAILSIILLRQEAPVGRPNISADAQPTPAAHNISKLLELLRAKMPWHQGADDIRDLADLPKLRNGDVHPDAPARRPLSAVQDLPTLELTELAIVPEDAPAPKTIEAVIVPVEQAATFEPEAKAEAAHETVFVENAVIAEAAPHAEVMPVPAPVPAAQPSIADMVAQLESAVAQRHHQLAELEAVAATIASEQPSPVPHAVPDMTAVLPEPVAADEPEEAFVRRPVLEAVPSNPVKDSDIDSALAAALDTLHRMNVAAR